MKSSLSVNICARDKANEADSRIKKMPSIEMDKSYLNLQQMLFFLASGHPRSQEI